MQGGCLNLEKGEWKREEREADFAVRFPFSIHRPFCREGRQIQ